MYNLTKQPPQQNVYIQ